MAEERDPALRRDLTGLRLRDVVKQGAETKCLPARQLVGQRRREVPGDGRRLLAHPAFRRELELDRGSEHGTCVLMHVEVVIAALLDAAQRRELGKHGVGHAEPVHQLETRERAIGDEDPLELGEHPLRRDGSERRRARGGRRDSFALELEAEFAGEPCQPQRSQRIVHECMCRDHPQALGADICQPSERVDVIASAERFGDRVDRHVALGEVMLDRIPVEWEHVDLPRVIARDHTPPPEILGEPEGVRIGRVRQLPRELARLRVDGHVEVGRAPPEQPVSDGSPDQPRLAGEPGERLERRRHAGSPSR